MNPKRILIVEDSLTVVEQMRLFLRNENYKVTHAGSEFGMYQMIEEYGKVVDLIIMDLTLKNENGLDLIDNLRKNEKYSKLPVIVVTEHAQVDFILRAKELQVSDYIRKPITKETFIKRIERTISQSTDTNVADNMTHTSDS